MKLVARFTLNVKDFESIDKSSVERLMDKYNCTISISGDETNNLWISCYKILVNCPDNTPINNLVKDLYSLFGGDNWHVLIDLDNPDKLVPISENGDTSNCLTIETVLSYDISIEY